MIRMSKMADYAIVIMAEMAREPLRSHSASEIALTSKITLPTVTKLLKMLSHAGLVSAIRGKAGGYKLINQPEHISAQMIIEAIDGPIALTECALKQGVCSREHGCAPKGALTMVSQTIAKALASVTLTALTNNVRPLSASPVMGDAPPNRASVRILDKKHSSDESAE